MIANKAVALFSKHHVGGRNGYGGFPYIPPVHVSIATTSYEADPTCCPQIEQEQARAGYAGVQAVPQCIGRSGEKTLFNLNYEPYTSSVLALNPKYQNFYYDMGAFDYTYRSAMQGKSK